MKNQQKEDNLNSNIKETDYELARKSIRESWNQQYNNKTKPNDRFGFNKKSDYKLQIKNANENIIKNANHWFLVNTISPQIRKNEEKKRTHKTFLLVFVIAFLIIQFGFLGYLIYWIFFNIFKNHELGISFSDSTIKLIFAFISGYITSIVIELIAILKYIVKNVFDTSVSGLANTFKENSEIKKSNSKEQEI